MKGKTKFFLFPVIALFFFMQLTGLLLPTEARTSSGISTGIAAQGGEWQLVQLLPQPPPWYEPPPPGDGNISITKINRFDAGGGDIEATIQQSSLVCQERDKTEVIGFTWTFTAPITRLRPGAIVPVDITVRLLRGNPPCSQAEGRTELFLHRTDWNVSPPFMPNKEIWPRFCDAYAPGVRANYYLQPPGAEKGRSGFKINEATPGPTDPKFGWFAFTITTTATRAGYQNQYVHFFYKYAFGGVAPEMFYEHISFNGASFSATADMPFVGWEWNDRISSVRVPRGKVIVLYEHRDYGGQSLTLTSDAPDLRQFRGPGRDGTWNDAVSSIRLMDAQ